MTDWKLNGQWGTADARRPSNTGVFSSILSGGRRLATSLASVADHSADRSASLSTFQGSPSSSSSSNDVSLLQSQTHTGVHATLRDRSAAGSVEGGSGVSARRNAHTASHGFGASRSVGADEDAHLVAAMAKKTPQARIFDAKSSPESRIRLYILAAVLFMTVFILIVTTGLARGTRGVWLSFNDDTLTTSYANLMVAPVTDRSMFGNSQQTTSEYIRYGDFVEFLTSSINFLLERGKPIDTNRASHVSTTTRTPFRSHSVASKRSVEQNRRREHPDALEFDGDSYTIGESHFLNAYHRRLGNFSSSVSVNATHLNLASIDTISKANFSATRGAHLYGKLSFSTLNDGVMEESLSLDPHNAHFRSDNVFFKRHVFIGDDLYFGVHREHAQRSGVAASEHSIYLPLLSVSADYRLGSLTPTTLPHNDEIDGDAHVQPYVNSAHTIRVATEGTSNEYTLNVGSGDVDHVSLLAAQSAVIGIYSRHQQQHDVYEATLVATAQGLFQRRPVYTQYARRSLGADARLATNVHSLSGDEFKRREALAKVMQLQVHRYDLVDTVLLDESLRSAPEHEWPVIERNRVSVLAQEIESILPDCVRDEQLRWPLVDRHGTSDEKETPGHYSVLYRQINAKTLDTDTLVMHLLLAVQEQQRTIDQLRERVVTLEQANKA